MTSVYDTIAEIAAARGTIAGLRAQTNAVARIVRERDAEILALRARLARAEAVERSPVVEAGEIAGGDGVLEPAREAPIDAGLLEWRQAQGYSHESGPLPPRVSDGMIAARDELVAAVESLRAAVASPIEAHVRVGARGDGIPASGSTTPRRPATIHRGDTRHPEHGLETDPERRARERAEQQRARERADVAREHWIPTNWTADP